VANTTETTRRKEDKGSVQHTAENVIDKAKDVASTVGEKAKNVASAVGDRADSAVSSVGSGMQSAADTVRDKGPQSGMLGKATEGVACGLESGGRYLEEHGLSGMADDLTNLIRRNPVPALLIGVGIGFLLARLLRS
jgi:ElaB/YqjD/DUF883 family membrane-anchored ribosome-binding protein